MLLQQKFKQNSTALQRRNVHNLFICCELLLHEPLNRIDQVQEKGQALWFLKLGPSFLAYLFIFK